MGAYMLPDEGSTAGRDRDYLSDGSIGDELGGLDHRVGQSDVVPDLRDEARPRLGLRLSQSLEVSDRRTAWLLYDHGLARSKGTHSVRDHVHTLGVHHDRVDAWVVQDLLYGARLDVVLVREVGQPWIVVRGSHDFDALDLPKRPHASRGVWMRDPQ